MLSNQKKILLSVIIPIYNEEMLIEVLCKRTLKAVSEISDKFELIFVNDGSNDNSLNLLIKERMSDARIKIIDLSRNFGHQPAVLAGLSEAKGEYIGVMDGDLQDPPELFENFLHQIEKGFDVVYAVRKKRKENVAKKIAYWLYYRLLNKMIDFEFPLDSGDFCLMKKKVVEQMLISKEQSIYLRGTRSWVGFKQVGFEYERDKRYAGSPKYGFKELLQLAYNGIFSFSSFPIRLLRRLGYFTIFISVLLFVRVIVNYFKFQTAPEGFVSLMVVIVFFGGVQLISLGLLGEYIFRIYNEAKKKPSFIVKKKYH